MDNARKNYLQTAITALTEDEAFLAALTECKTLEQLQALLLENKIEVTSEEIIEFTAEGNEAIKNAASCELSEADLDDVSGGGALRKAGRFLVSLAGGAVLGFICGACPVLAPAGVKIAVIYGSATAIWVANG